VLQLTCRAMPLTVNLCTVCGCVHLVDTSKGLLDTILDFLIICHCEQLRMPWNFQRSEVVVLVFDVRLALNSKWKLSSKENETGITRNCFCLHNIWAAKPCCAAVRRSALSGMLFDNIIAAGSHCNPDNLLVNFFPL